MAEAMTPITYDEVVSAAEGLRAEGAKATILAIREKLGRGSFSTIKKHLDRWSTGEQQPVSPRVPVQLESLWREARRTAEVGLEEERNALEKLSADLESRLEVMELAVTEANQARAQAETRLADRTTELERACDQINDLRAQRNRSETKRDAAEAALVAERELIQERWLQLLGSLESVHGLLAELREQGTTLAALVQNSEETVTAQWKEVSVLERQFRAVDNEALRNDVAELIAPLSSVPSSIESIRRQLSQQAHKRFTARGSRLGKLQKADYGR